MEQIYLKDNSILFKVKKAPLIVRVVLFIFTFLFFLFPITSIASIIMGTKISAMPLVLVGIFLFSGIYLMRLTLWNTYGKELICINQSKLTYQASYGWFQANIKEMSIFNVKYSVKPHPSGNNLGVLIMSNGETAIESVIPLQNILLEDLIKNLKNLNYE